MNAPSDWPAEPRKVISIVPSGNPLPPKARVISAPSIVPTVRFTFRTGRSMRTNSCFVNAGCDEAIS
ncbi:unannotated protein [freshwater metagenome]|uniref:Unannotated protein n=1 Tax=freshwater metagenome TaxID=449393 RepID=A0A6J6RCZ8_9ZZZZ